MTTTPQTVYGRMAPTRPDFVDTIIAYEEGLLDPDATLDLFADLIRSGRCWTLQGHYGRTAARLIEEGWISPGGDVLLRPSQIMEEAQ